MSERTDTQYNLTYEMSLTTATDREEFKLVKKITGINVPSKVQPSHSGTVEERENGFGAHSELCFCACRLLTVGLIWLILESAGKSTSATFYMI
jgi:hypothetical protein